MSGCCLDTVAGAPTSGGGGSANAVPLQGLRISGITAATPTGSTDTTVILFANPPSAFGSIPIGDWVTVSNDAADGTTFEIIEAGFYQVLLYVPISTDWLTSVTLNATVAQRQSANPEPSQPEVFGTAFEVAGGSVGTPPHHPVIPVTQADIDAGGGRNVIRCHVTDVLNPGTPPAAGSFPNEDEVACRIFKIAEIDG